VKYRKHIHCSPSRLPGDPEFDSKPPARALAPPIARPAPAGDRDGCRVDGDWTSSAISWCATHGARRVELVPYVPGADRDEYHILHGRTYAHYGVTHAKRASDQASASCSHLVLMRDDQGTLIAGMRIHQGRRGRLPIELALPYSRPLNALLARLPNTIELSGAVVARHARGQGLAVVLMRAAVAATAMIDGRSIIGFGHQYVWSLYSRFGLLPEPSLPIYRYPDRRYRSRILVHRDPLGLGHLAAAERDRVLQVRRQLHHRVRLRQPAQLYRRQVGGLAR